MKNSGSGPKYAVSPMPDGLEIRLGALGKRARIAFVALAVGRLDHVAGDEQRGLVHERIDVRRSRDRASAACRTPGCPSSRRSTSRRMRGRISNLSLVNCLAGTGDVLFLAAGIREAEVDELHFLVFDRFQYVGGRCHANLLMRFDQWGMKCANSSAKEIARTMPYVAAPQPAVFGRFSARSCTYGHHFAPRRGGMPTCLCVIGAFRFGWAGRFTTSQHAHAAAFQG